MINLWLTLSYDNGFNNWHTSTILSVATNPKNYKRKFMNMINLWHSLSYDNGFNIWHTSTILSVATNPLKI